MIYKKMKDKRERRMGKHDRYRKEEMETGQLVVSVKRYRTRKIKKDRKKI